MLGGSSPVGERRGVGYGDHLSRYRFAAEYARDAEVLDFGCGNGYGTRILAQSGARRVHAVDVDPVALSSFVGNTGLAGTGTDVSVARINADFDDYVRLESRFDLVVCFEVMEHIRPSLRHHTLSRIVRCLRPSGRLLISTPNWDVTRESMAVGDVPLNPYHFREPTQQELVALLLDSDVSVQDLFGQFPRDPVAFQRRVRLQQWTLTRPLERIVGRRFYQLPSRLRKVIFQTTTFLGWIATGKVLETEADWPIRKFDSGELPQPVHLLAVAVR